VSVISLAAKLWLVSYSHRALDTVGTPYERAMKRQEAYSGVSMENGGRDKYITTLLARRFHHVWVLCLVRYSSSCPYLTTNHHFQHISFSSSRGHWLRRRHYPHPGAYITCHNISCCSIHSRMSVPLLFFDRYTAWFRVSSEITSEKIT